VVGGGGGGGDGRVRLAMLALSFVSLPITIAVAVAFSLASRKIVLMEGAMTLLVEVAVAVEAAAGVQRLAIHSVWLLEASGAVLVSASTRQKHGDAQLGVKRAERAEGRVWVWMLGAGS
jgi:hypothetical protein